MNVVITKELLAQIRTHAGGYTQAQLDLLGVPWPPKKNWPQSVINRSVTPELWAQIVAAREIDRKARRELNRPQKQETLF